MRKSVLKFLGLLHLGLIVVSFNSYDALSVDPWYEKRYRGWYWYEDLEEKKLQEKLLQSKPKTLEEAESQIEAISKTIKASRSLAILNPTIENTKNYVEMQKWLLDVSQRFASSWSEVIRKYPHLNEHLTHPITGKAFEVSEEIKGEETSSKLAFLSKHFGLLLVASSTCKFCKEFAPQMIAFAAKHNFALSSLMLDGGTLDGISKINNPLLKESLKQDYVPALFLINPDTAQIIKVSDGLIDDFTLTGILVKVRDLISNKESEVKDR